MDALLLSRLQFAFTVAFHYLFPPLSIGLGLFLVLVEGRWIRKRNPVDRQIALFWTRVFGLVFAIGVASGIVMEFQFGTNWSSYSRFVGDVFGSALAAEGIFAFFLESGFLALLLFGWNRISPRLHFFSTCMVALGAHFSAIWIIVANSWQQTPAGHLMGTWPDGTPRAVMGHFWQAVFNPSTLDRLSHTVTGAWQAGAWLVISVSAWYLLKNRHVEFAKRALKVALIVALASSVLQIWTGHSSARGVAKYQPPKMAAFEGHYQTGPAPMYLWGWPDGERVRFGLPVPGMLSLLLHGSPSAKVIGLDQFKPEDRPPVNLVFQSYHVMITLGMLLFALSVWSLWQWKRGRLFQQRWLLYALVFSVLGPQIANQLGWMSAEVGRQPWIVYGLLRTADAASKVVGAGQIALSLILFGIIYALLFAVFIYLLNHKIQKGPEEEN